MQSYTKIAKDLRFHQTIFTEQKISTSSIADQHIFSFFSLISINHMERINKAALLRKILPEA